MKSLPILLNCLLIALLLPLAASADEASSNEAMQKPGHHHYKHDSKQHKDKQKETVFSEKNKAGPEKSQTTQTTTHSPSTSSFPQAPRSVSSGGDSVKPN